MKPQRLLSISLADEQTSPTLLPPLRHWPLSHHVFDKRSVWAVNAALASGRPLLLRGEPGSGKSQLARAVAQVLQRPFLSRVVNARFEPEDLLYRFDAVARLAQAQILPATNDALKQIRAELYLLPEVLWWALNPKSARRQHAMAAAHCGEVAGTFDEVAELGFPFTDDAGAVVLLDEMDKADSEVPNSLLETLSLGGFPTPYGLPYVKAEGVPPLIMIATNEDRELPAAFVRRCLVLQMDLPKDESGALDSYLRARANAHFLDKPIDPRIVDAAIQQLKVDRAEMVRRDLRPPGQAELIDLLKAVSSLADDYEGQKSVLEETAAFAFKKHRDL